MSLPNVTSPASGPEGPENLYGYVPTLSVCIAFIVLFALSAVIHAAEAYHFRMKWLYPTACLAGISEVVGWSARLWSSISPTNDSPYIMQMSVTIMAPSPLVGALFITFEKISERLGEHYGRLRPKWYSRIFLTCDIISLITQGAGGGLAGSANGNHDQLDLGGTIMLAGIVFQLTSIVVFVVLMIEYFIRYGWDLPVRTPQKQMVDKSAATLTSREPLGTRMQLMILCVCLNTIYFVVRSIYRTVELVDGFDGSIIQTQIYFNLFDGGMIVLAMYTLNVLHPGWLLRTEDTKSLAPQMEEA